MTIASRYQRIEDIPKEIPLFPLHEVILLPRTNLPLTIFEPRYLSMIEDAMSTNQVIGIIQPSNQNEDVDFLSTDMDLQTIGCAGRITEYTETDDDRILISLTGIARFQIKEEIKTDRPYRIARADFSAFADDLLVGLGETIIDREHFLDVLKTYLQANNLDADWDSINEASNEFLVNTLSIISPYGSEEKQALLEAASIKNRADVLIALAEMELATVNQDGNHGRLQ